MSLFPKAPRPARLLATAILAAGLGLGGLGAGSAQAQPFAMPGLQRDAGSYARDLTRRFPAGASTQQRAQAEKRALDAEARGDWEAAAQAWEQRLGMPDAKAEMWLSLARAQLARPTPDLNRALQAAWQNFTSMETGPAEIPALKLMAEALQRQDQWVPAIAALEAVVERARLDPAAREALATARRAAGLLVRTIRTEPEAEPARACIGFTGRISQAGDFRAGDWVRAEPAIPDLAVTREQNALCVAGLPWGQTTKLVLRAGLPGEDGARLRAETPVSISMRDRAPRIGFDATRFLLPRGQAARVGIATMNIRTLKLRLVRLTERNLLPFGRQNPLGEAMESWSVEEVPESWGRVVWQGSAEVPGFRANTAARIQLPLPAEITGAGPGLYVLIASEPGQRGSEANGNGVVGALQIVATDLGVTAWRSSEGLAAQVRSLQGAAPRAGVKVALMARNNDVLAEAETGADGLVRFNAPLLRGTGPLAPVALHASAGDDLVGLNLEAAAFDLSDRGAEGLPHPGPVDSFLWTERGIYRPGETVNLTGLLRDAAGAPRDLPLRLRLLRPNGQVAAETVPPRAPDGAIAWRIPLSAGAAAGVWTVEARLEPDQPPVGKISFRVDAFVPERLAVSFGPAPGPLVPGTPLAIPLAGRFLYGAPAADLEAEVEGQLSLDPEPFAPDTADGRPRRSPWAGWRFGLAEEPLNGGQIPGGLVQTDAEGKAVFRAELAEVPDVTRPLRASYTVSLADPNGRASRATVELPVLGRVPYIAIRPAFEGGSVDVNTEAGFDVALVAPDGSALSGRLSARLVRERPEWRLVTRGSVARYETIWRDEPVDTATLQTEPSKPARFARSLPFGRYRLEVSKPGSLAIAAIRFRSGWVGSDSAEVPDKVDVSADRQNYADGATAKIRINPPFAGRASLAVVTNRLVSLREVEVPAGGTTVDLPVEAAWGPGAYVTVTVFRPGSAAEGQPRRALGLAWVALDPAPRRLEVALDVPDQLRPRQRVEIPVRVANAGGQPVRLTLAAVDEGVLRITQFATPDPVKHFLGRRRLGADIRDDYGRLIPPPEGELAVLRQGGDGDAEGAGVQPPQRVVSLFSGIVEAGPDGVARVPLDLPDFAGEIRLMAVAWSGNRVGAASKPLQVRDPVIAEALLPRFLAPGDSLRLPVLLHNLELPNGEVAAEIKLEGPLAFDGASRVAATLATGARAEPFLTLKATGAGEGVLRLTVTGPNNYRAERESRITIRSSRPRLTEVAVTELAPGAEAKIAPDLSGFVPGTAQVVASWGQPVRYDAEALRRASLEFPLWCAEQTATKLLALSTGQASEPRNLAMADAVARLLDKQRWDGAFGAWSAQGDADQWISAYATEALLRARDGGATVPEAALTAALENLARTAEDVAPEKPEEFADQAYRLHALALAGRPMPGATRRLAEALDQLPTPLSRAQLGAALMRIGDAPRATLAFQSALDAPARTYWTHDYGSPARDLLAVTLLLRESGLLPERLSAQLGRLPGARDLTPDGSSTQDQAWGILLASALGRDGRPVRMSVDGAAVPPAATVVRSVPAGGLAARNGGDRAVLQAVSVTGLPLQPQPAARAGLRISRKFLAMDGSDVNLDDLRQNRQFILLIEARSETGEAHRALIQQGLPAGWEIATRLPSGNVPGMPFLGTLTEAESVAALDDRFAVAAPLSARAAVVRFAVVVRAVTPGSFELPGAQVQDMYRPGVFARQNTGRITVLSRE
ncbi:alpha-2-macroglobulin [Roseomonas sp. USHLN139]|uniref:alpha-2-macroglobulin n=1 Tax=Roseomonas sp. USHLN139 TaxID=3081298 RepID=UPI003B02041C